MIVVKNYIAMIISTTAKLVIPQPLVNLLIENPTPAAVSNLRLVFQEKLSRGVTLVVGARLRIKLLSQIDTQLALCAEIVLISIVNIVVKAS